MSQRRKWGLLALVIAVIIALIIFLICTFTPRETVSAPPETDGSNGTVMVEPTYGVPAAYCTSTTHRPHPLYPASPSWILYLTLLVVTQGLLDSGTAFEVETPGADVESVAGIVSPKGVLAAAVPISSYDDYAAGSIWLRTPGGAQSVVAATPGVTTVTASEQSLTCSGDAEALALLEEYALEIEVLFGDAEAFLDEFDGWHSSGDVSSLAESLHPAVLDRYGRQGCVDYLEGVVGTISNVTLIEERSEPWNYSINGYSSQILNARTLTVDATLGGEPTQTDLHVAAYDGTLRWFTECGEPLPRD